MKYNYEIVTTMKK